MRDFVAVFFVIVWITPQRARAAQHYSHDSEFQTLLTPHHHDGHRPGLHSRSARSPTNHVKRLDQDIAVLDATGGISWHSKIRGGRSRASLSGDLANTATAAPDDLANTSTAAPESQTDALNTSASMPMALKDRLSAQGIANDSIIVCSKPSNYTNDSNDSQVTCHTQNGTEVKRWSCEGQQICCNPALRTVFYKACLLTECGKVHTDPACSKYSMCTKSCGMNCCCFFMGVVHSVTNGFGLMKAKSMKITMAINSIFSASRSNSSSGAAAEGVEAYNKFMMDTLSEVLALAFGLPVGAFIFIHVYDALKKRLLNFLAKVFKKENLRSDFMTKEMREEMMKDKNFAQKEKLREFVAEKELEALGGVQQMLVTEVSGMSAFKWAKTQMLSLGLYFFIVKEPVEVNVCVLGKSGRLLVVARKPMYPADEAARVLVAAGLSIVFCTIMGLLYLRSVEHVLKLAVTSSDPALKASVPAAKMLGELIAGKVRLYVFAGFALLWLGNLIIGKLTIKMWGYSDAKNYYESNTASCAQYFRTGIKGLPGVKPRRVGGMRIFFGPYPLPRIWEQLGQQYKTLKCLKPLPKLPVEANGDGVPKSGNGTPPSPEDRATYLQLGLAMVNSFLGCLGLFFFAVNIYNLLINVQNCPTGSAVGACVKDGNCAFLARSPWFVHHLQSKNLMTADEMASEAIRPQISIDDVGKYLKVATVGEAKKEVDNIARTSCGMMQASLIQGAEGTRDGLIADWLGRKHSAHYLQMVKEEKLNITYDHEHMHCAHCVRAMTLWYFSDMQNVVELCEIFLLLVVSYVAGLVASMMADQLTNCPMVDVRFEADPTSSLKIDLNQVEVDCLSIIGQSFFFRYHYSGTPANMDNMEVRMKSKREDKHFDTTKLSDAWAFDSTAQSWDDYRLYDPKRQHVFLVSMKLLGLLLGEEVVHAWSVPTPFTTQENIFIILGIIFWVGMPFAWAYKHSHIPCAVEALLGGLIHYALVDFFILRRRPQSGIVLTTRRIFQITRTARYLTLLGYTEPLIKLDILLHDCSIYYGSLQMEAFVPLWRRVLARLFRFPVYRRGQVISQGSIGVFSLWRRRGDTYNVVNYISHITRVNPLATLNPKMGQVLMLEEKVAGEGTPPDPTCSCWTCPYTAPVMMMGNTTNLVDRYLVREKNEKDVYGRMLAVRPATCSEICCGGGLWPKCECCWCCKFNEVITEFLVSSHRVVVEQRVSHRYCRIFSCCKSTPNIRCTFLALSQAAAYVAMQPCKQLGISRLQQDFTLKLLQAGSREYQPGLMLNQKPYMIFTEKDLPLKPKIWVDHTNMIFDQLTQKQPEADENSERSGSGAEDNSEDDDFYDEMVEEAAEEGPAPAGKGRAPAGKGPAGKGKKKGARK